MAPALQRTRLRGKQAPTDPRVKKDTNVIKQVYLVSVPDLREPVLRRLRQKTPARDPREPVLRRLRQKTPLALRSPGVYSREDIEKMFIDAAARPVYEDSRNQHHRGIAQSKQAVPRAPKWKQPVFDYAAAGIDPNDI